MLRNGYKVKIFNSINFKKSHHYNPFAYIHSEKDILKLVTTLIANTKGDGKSGDDFWQKAETLLYTALIGVPLFFLLKGHIGSSAAALCMMLVMLPFFLLAMYEKNGQPPEKLIRNIVQVCFLRPKQRPYRTNNFYDLLNRQDILDKEVYAIVHKQNPRKKAHTSRAKADRRGDCKSQASG